jgi:hypothetical protein
MAALQAEDKHTPRQKFAGGVFVYIIKYCVAED